MMNILKASNNIFGVISLPLHHLSPTIPYKELNIGDYNRIKGSVLVDGCMRWPIIALPNTKEARGTTVFPPPLVLPEEGKEMVMCGNNRWWLAVELGYTHIHTLLCTTIEESSEWCSKQRKDWVERGER